MTLLVGFLGAALLGAVLWLGGRSLFAAPQLQRTNHRGIAVPVGAGVLLVVAVVAVSALVGVAAAAGTHLAAPESASLALTLTLVSGFGILGLLDDLAAHGDDKGFRGHLRALAAGRLSTGALKLVGGALVALAVVGQTGPDSLVDLVVGAALVALAANLGNLFDRAPGRVIKVAGIALVVLIAAAGSDRADLFGPVVAVGAGFGLLAFDLREELMLGDAGANVLGAALGLGVVLTGGIAVQAVVLVVLAALNVVSERVSFSAVIRRVAPLRLLDELGRPSPS